MEYLPLPRSFHARRADVVARALVGCVVTHRDGDTTRRARIVETEAYLGPHDLACHTSKGRTARNAAMWGAPGHAYWNSQTIARIARGQTDPGVLVASPIWEWMPDDDGLRIEAGFQQAEIDALRGSVGRTIDAPRWGCKSAQQVVRIPRGVEPWMAAADPRTVGLALAI